VTGKARDSGVTGLFRACLGARAGPLYNSWQWESLKRRSLACIWNTEVELQALITGPPYVIPCY